jgi:hypothetical protein
MRPSLFATITLVACSSQNQRIDGHSGQQVPATITVSGTATARSSATPIPVVGVTVNAYLAGTVVASATTDAVGAYAMTIDTHGTEVDVSLRTSAGSYVDTYRYFESPLAGDQPAVALDMFTPSAYALAYSSMGVTHQTGTALLELEAADVNGAPLASAVLGDTSGTVKYTTNGHLNATATSTSSDGIGFVLNAAAGSNLISATAMMAVFNNAEAVEGVGGSVDMAVISAGLGGD